MPAKSEKQRKFFGTVMGAKKTAKSMSKKKIKDFLKKESYDSLVNQYLKTYLLEMDIRQDPREGFGGDPFVDPTEDMGEGDTTPQEMYDVVAKQIGDQKASMLSGEEIQQYYYDIIGTYFPVEDNEEAGKMDNEEECESAKQGCHCGGCPACNKEGGDEMLQFYGFTK